VGAEAKKRSLATSRFDRGFSDPAPDDCCGRRRLLPLNRGADCLLSQRSCPGVAGARGLICGGRRTGRRDQQVGNISVLIEGEDVCATVADAGFLLVPDRLRPAVDQASDRYAAAPERGYSE
jgi:hypothetical protein